MLNHAAQQAVAQGLRDGSRTAWAELYDAYSSDVWRHVARLVGGNSAVVADVVQEVFLAAARSARTFDASRGSLRSWLLGIAHRQVALYWRGAERVDRWRQLVEAGAVEIRQWLDGGESAVEGWERRETADLVRGVLADLPAEYAALLTGKYLDQHSLEQLAAQEGASVEATKSKLARARREFRSQFEQRAGSDRTGYQS